MTSLRVANDLASVLVPIGVTGAVLAGLCALVAAVAIVRGASGLSGGAVGVWIPCAMLTLAAGFANQWMPLLVSGALLVGMLTFGGVVRALVVATAPGREASRRLAEEHRVQTEAAVPSAVAAGGAVFARAAATAGAPARPAVGAALTGTVSTLTRSNTAKAA